MILETPALCGFLQKRGTPKVATVAVMRKTHKPRGWGPPSAFDISKRWCKHDAQDQMFCLEPMEHDHDHSGGSNPNVSSSKLLGMIISLVMTNITIEHGHRNTNFSHSKWWCSIVMLVYLRVIPILGKTLKSWNRAAATTFFLIWHNVVLEDAKRNRPLCTPWGMSVWDSQPEMIHNAIGC